MKRRFSEAMNEIRKDYIEEALEVRQSRRNPVLRWAALAACMVLVLGLSMGFLLNGQTPDNGIVLPPARIGKTEGKGSLYRSFSFEEAIEEAEVVAWIRVGNWLGENYEIFTSYFEAEVVACYKGQMPEEFVLEQTGNSEFSYKGYPIFTSGNEMLVFLNATNKVPYENCYWIIGGFSTVLDVVKDQDGNTYAMDIRGYLGKSINEYKTNYADNRSLNFQLCNVLKEIDDVWEGQLEKVEYIFLLEDMFSN